MYFFLRWMRTQRQGALLAWVGFTTLLLYTHYIGAFTAIVEGLYALVFLRGQARWRALGALAASVTLLAPWLLLVGTRQVVNRGAGWAFEADSYLIGELLENFSSSAADIGLALFGLVTVAYTSQTGAEVASGRAIRAAGNVGARTACAFFAVNLLHSHSLDAPHHPDRAPACSAVRLRAGNFRARRGFW
jgi:hypothetical protein